MASDFEEQQLLSRESESDDTLTTEDAELFDNTEKVGFLRKLIARPSLLYRKKDQNLLSWKRKQPQTVPLAMRLIKGLGIILLVLFSFYVGYMMEGPNLGVCNDYLTAKLVPAEILPYLKSEESQPYITTYAARFMINESDPSMPFYRKKPSIEVDVAWYNASRDRLMLLTEEDLVRQGKNPEEHVKLPDEWGYGEHKYPVRLWHLHRLHCLDSLRRMLYRDYYNETHPTDVRHAAHCIATLYEFLHCHPSWDILHYVWIDGVPKPWADWRQVEVCTPIQPMYELDATHDKDMPGSPNGDKRVRFLMPPDSQYKFPMTQATMDYINQAKEEHPNWPSLQRHWDMRKELLEETLDEWHRTGIVPTWDSEYGWF